MCTVVYVENQYQLQTYLFNILFIIALPNIYSLFFTGVPNFTNREQRWSEMTQNLKKTIIQVREKSRVSLRNCVFHSRVRIGRTPNQIYLVLFNSYVLLLSHYNLIIPLEIINKYLLIFVYTLYTWLFTHTLITFEKYFQTSTVLYILVYSIITYSMNLQLGKR